MNIDKLKVFKTEDELRSFAKVNGYDEGATTTLVAKWKSIGDEPIVRINAKKVTVMVENDIETKNTLDF